MGCGSNVCCLGPGRSAPPPPRSPFPPLLGAPRTTPLLSITSTGTPSLHEGHFSFRDSTQFLGQRVKRNMTRLRLILIFRFCVVWSFRMACGKVWKRRAGTMWTLSTADTSLDKRC